MPAGIITKVCSVETCVDKEKVKLTGWDMANNYVSFRCYSITVTGY